MDYRQKLTEKQKIVIKIGTSTITYPESGEINIGKLEKFVRILINLRNEGKEVIVVSSGAVGIGRNVLGFDKRPEGKAEKQACAAVGQARLMMMYEKIFAEYGQVAAQVLLTKEAIVNESCARNAKQTFEKLSEMKVALAALKDILAKASAIKDNKEKAFAYLHEVCPAMVALRKPADELEMLVDKELWPFPSYGDLVFEV